VSPDRSTDALEVESGQATERTVGASGGAVSLPPPFSMNVPSGALGTNASITVQRRLTAPFPSDVGVVLLGTSFDLAASGLAFALPVKVQMRVSASRCGQRRHHGGRVLA